MRGNAGSIPAGSSRGGITLDFDKIRFTERVAMATGIPESKVVKVLAAAFKDINLALRAGYRVKLPRLGVVYWRNGRLIWHIDETLGEARGAIVLRNKKDANYSVNVDLR